MRIILVLLMFTFFACGDSSSSSTNAEGTETSANGESSSDDSKSYQAEIKDRLSGYLKVMNDGKYEKSLDYTYPELFKIVPKDQMLAAIKMAFEMDGMDVSISDTEILSVSDNLVEQDGKKFTTVDYKMKMKMALSGQMAAVGPMMLEPMEQQYGAGNVDFDEESTTLTINAKNTMIAVKQGGEWFFGETGAQQAPIIKQLFDADLLKKLGIEI